MQDLIKVTIFGFVFGIIFSTIAYIGNFEVEAIFLWTIPFFISILCGVGMITGVFVTNVLRGRGLFKPVLVFVISFLSAAFVNGVIVYTILAYTGVTTLHKEVILGSFLGLGMGATYGIYTYRMERMNEKMKFLEELSDKNQQLQEASRKLAITEERNRMGRELHDSVSQGLHGLVFSLHSLRNELSHPSERVSEILSYMEAGANATLDELRSMIEELKPSLLAEEGLQEAITVTANLYSQRKEVPVDFEMELPNTLDPNLEMAMYRITQEALANIEKHAQARHVHINIITDNEYVILTIRDDGQGFIRQKTSQGNGLENMRRRVEEEGGMFDLISKPGAGTTIIAKFPPKG